MPNRTLYKFSLLALALMMAVGAPWVLLRNEEVPRTVRVGWYVHPPLITQDPKTNHPSGYHVELLEEIASRENLRLEYVKADRSEIMDGLGGGKEFLMAVPITITEERKEFIDFTWPIGDYTPKIAGRVGKSATDEFIGMEMKYFGALRGTVQMDVVKYWFEAGLIAGIEGFDTSEALIDGVLSGKVDFILDESEFIDALLLQHPDSIIIVEDTSLSAPPLFKAFPVAKGQGWLRGRINQGLRKMMNDGAYSAIYRKYFNTNNPTEADSQSGASGSLREDFFPDIVIDDNYNAREILDNYFDMISNESEGVRGQASIDFINSKIRDGKHEFAYKLHRSKVRLNELLLLIDGQPRNAPYFAAFYYRQIEDLRIASMVVRARLEGHLQRFEMENTQTRNNLKMIQALEIPNSDLLWRKNWIKTNYDSIIAGQARWIEQIEDLLKQTVEFQAKLNEIMADAEHNLIENYEGYFSYRFDFLGNAYGRAGISFQWYELSRSLNGWVVALPTQLLVIIPDKHWWPNLAGLALVTLLLAAIAAPLVARYRWFTLAKYLRPYISGWLGIYFALGIIILPSTSKDLFFSLAMLFIALAIMDSAWKARNNDKSDLRRNPLLLTILSLALIDFMTDLLAPIRVTLAAMMVLGIINILWFVHCYKFPGPRPTQDIPSILLTGGLVWFGAGIAAWMGYLYPAMLIAVFGGLTLCVLYAGTVFTRFLLLVSNALTSGRRSWASFISTLVIPFLWLGLFIGAIHWAASVFNANWFFLHIYDIDLVPAVSIEISLRKLLVLLLIGLLVRFTLSWLGEMLAVISDSRQLDLVSINSTFLVVRYLVWILFILFVLASLHIEWDNLKWILGGLSVGFGFALKDILENFFSGIIVLIGKQVRPGDTIEFGTVYGKVDKINVRATFIKTEDNALIAIPNSQIVSKEFRNWTLNGDIRRNQFEVGVAYGSDIQFVIETMLEVMNASNLVLKVIPPDVLFIDFASSAILLRARYWVHVDSRSISASLLRRRMEEVFRDCGIVIAFPQLDVHIDTSAASPSLLPV